MKRRTVLLTSLGGVVAAAAAPEMRYYRQLRAVTSSLRDSPAPEVGRIRRIDAEHATAILVSETGERAVHVAHSAMGAAVGDYVIVDGDDVVGVLTPDEASYVTDD